MECLSCQTPLDPAAFLAGARGYSWATNSGIAPCPHCHGDLEFRVHDGHLTLGYTYWAGSMHFEGIETGNVPGLRITRSPSGAVLEMKDREIARMPAA